MKYLVRLMLCACLLSYSLPANATTGNEWKGMRKNARISYILGVVDGWINVGSVRHARQEQQCSVYDILYDPIVSCVTKKNAKWNGFQMFAVVEKYMKDHPEEWNIDFSVIIFFAITNACEKKKLPTLKGK